MRFCESKTTNKESKYWKKFTRKRTRLSAVENHPPDNFRVLDCLTRQFLKTFVFVLGQPMYKTKNAGKRRHSHYRLYLKFGGWAAPILMPAITKGGQRTKQVCGPRAAASKRVSTPWRFINIIGYYVGAPRPKPSQTFVYKSLTKNFSLSQGSFTQQA